MTALFMGPGINSYKMKAAHTKAQDTGKYYAVTADGRYFVVRGRLWRRSNPDLPESKREHLVSELMSARRAVARAKKQDDAAGIVAAHARVDEIKRALGERGQV